VQLRFYYQHIGVKHLINTYINIYIYKVTTYINYVMVTNMVLK
jgi:hypothetical protein